MKKKRLKKQNIFILFNILILLGISGFYAYRLVYYYKLEHPKLEEEETFSSLVVSVNDDLYKNDDQYIFKGKEVNNYVKYSGRLWRIVSVNADGSMKMITDDIQTLLVWGTGNYEDSYIRNWLNKSDKTGSGIFYNSLNNPEKYLKTSSFCIDELLESQNTCDKTIDDLIGLLSKSEYEVAGGADSYLNIDAYWWTNNKSSDGVWYVYAKGNLNDDSDVGSIRQSYGVRPVVTLNKEVALISGDGTKEKPYIIEEKTDNVINMKNIGDYISYSGMNFRIIEKDFSYVKVVLDGFIKENNEDLVKAFGSINNVYALNTGIGYYLNNTFYKSLENQDYLIEGVIYTNRYDNTVDYDYTKIRDTNIKGKVGLLQVGDFFISDYSDYFLGTRTSTYEGTVYKVIEDGKICADAITSKAKIRPVVFLKPDLEIISGDGTRHDPYKIK